MPNGQNNDEEGSHRKKRKQETHPASSGGRKRRAKTSLRPQSPEAAPDAPPSVESPLHQPAGPEQRFQACPYCGAKVKEKRLEKHKRICPQRSASPTAGPAQAQTAPRFAAPPSRTGGGRNRPRSDGRPFATSGGGRQRDRRSKKEFGVVAYSETDLAFREAQKRFHEAQAIEEARQKEGGGRNG